MPKLHAFYKKSTDIISMIMAKSKIAAQKLNQFKNWIKGEIFGQQLFHVEKKTS